MSVVKVSISVHSVLLTMIAGKVSYVVGGCVGMIGMFLHKEGPPAAPSETASKTTLPHSIASPY